MKRLRSCLPVVSVLSALIVLGGCGLIAVPIPPVPDGWTPLSTAQLQDEYDSARAIVDTVTRDRKLKFVAVNAADSNSPDMAIKATNAITTTVERNSAAGYCADRFDQLGNRTLAEEFIWMVSDIHQRDKLNSQLASRPTGINSLGAPATLP